MINKYIKEIVDYAHRRNNKGEFCSYRVDAYEEGRLLDMNCTVIEKEGVKIFKDSKGDFVGALVSRKKHHMFIHKKENDPRYWN